LGLTARTAKLDEIYTRAAELGLRLLPAEAGAQLRLQYLDQPVGEWLHIAMQPVAAGSGNPLIFEIGNSGAGLKLIGVGANNEFYSNARFVFAIAEQALEAKVPSEAVLAQSAPRNR